MNLKQLFRVVRDRLIEGASYLSFFQRVLLIKPGATSYEKYYRVIHEVINSNKLSNSVYCREDLSKIYKQLRIFNVRGDKLGDEWWLLLLEAVSNRSGQEKLIQSTKALNPLILTIREWLHIYTLTVRLSQFKLSYIVRELAIRHALENIDSKTCSRYDLNKKIGALVERSDISLAEKNVQIYAERFTDDNAKKYISLANEFLDMIRPCSGKFITANLSDLESKYSDYIFGKNIAIVGPAMVGLKNADDIDNHDRVLRFNYREKGLGLDPVHSGLKANISHFSNNQAHHLADNLKDSFDVDLDWVLVKRPRPYDKMMAVFQSREFTIRKIRLHHDLLFFGRLHGVPNCAIDLLRFSPASVKIFNADLTLTKTYFKNYDAEEYEIRGRLKKLDAYAHSNAMHDLIAQYNILKLLWDNGKISGDVRFTEVMEMGVEEYVNEIDRLYGNSEIKKAEAELREF